MLRTIAAIVISATLCIQAASGQENLTLLNSPPQIGQPAFAPSPADAVAYALADLGRLPKEIQPFQRYIWIPNENQEAIWATSYAINLVISKANYIVKPTVVANGRLMRIDLNKLAPNPAQFAGLFTNWEKLSDEPYFHGGYSEPIKVFVTPYVAKDGKTYNFVIANVKPFGAHTGLEQSVILQGLSKSNAPIVRYDWFLNKILTTLEGGMYYDFLGVERNPKKGTAQQAFLDSLGVDEQKVADIRSDQRAAIFKSKVTGRPRRIDIFRGVGGKNGTGLAMITHDIGVGDKDPKQHPIKNLLDFQDRAREIIVERNNGLHAFALFDAKGALQNSVPDDIAKDHTIPSPDGSGDLSGSGEARLEPGISCIRCHGPDDGIKPFTNDVRTMLAGRLDVFNDFSSKKSLPDTLDRLAGLYSGDLSKQLRRGRDDYSDAVFIATGGRSVPVTSEAVSNVHANYAYRMVSPQQACLELGYSVKKEQAAKFLQQMIPDLPPDETGISPEDPTLGALKAGISVNRFEFEQVYPDAAFRVLQTRKSLSSKK